MCSNEAHSPRSFTEDQVIEASAEMPTHTALNTLKEKAATPAPFSLSSLLCSPSPLPFQGAVSTSASNTTSASSQREDYFNRLFNQLTQGKRAEWAILIWTRWSSLHAVIAQVQAATPPAAIQADAAASKNPIKERALAIATIACC